MINGVRNKHLWNNYKCRAFLLLLTAVYLGIAACNAPAPAVVSENQGTIPDLAKLDAEETYPQIPVALAVVYKSVEELANDAEYIAEIEVQSADVLLRLPPLSLSNVEVITPLKGNIKADDIITVAEEGAMATEDREAVIVGAPVLNMGNRYILFLNKYEDNYIVLGVYQGKFIEREGYVFQQSTDDIKTDAFAPVTIEEFMANVRSLVGS